MAVRGPPRLREVSILLPDLCRDPDPHPAPAAPSRRAASRCGDRAGRSAAPGAGGRFVGGGRHRRGQRARRSALSPRSAPAPASAPLAPAVAWRCYRGCAAAFPPRKRPTAADSTEIGPGVTKLMEEKTKGLEAASFPSVAVGVSDASGRTNPVAFMSNVLCCVCLQNCHERKYFRGASLQIRPEDARRFQPGGKELWKKSSLKTASGDHQVFQPRRTRREMRESGSNS
ncbi:uncharacterized protein LOC127463330 isoform X4 [Manacus candei]|uniref:uncharacterized protein LOC127463330 isoform X4 n=1 Tax=Manacus candei TaxID=415023 RepID=UPI002227C8DF|nr:uncharacterized protein LOC127463330 isoform X4 [Manacus candei]